MVLVAARIAGFKQKPLAEHFGCCVAQISRCTRKAYEAAGMRDSHPTFLNQSRATDERFWDFVIPEPNSGCWLYSGGSNGKGYGSFGGHKGKGRRYAHIIAYEEANGPVPVGLEIDHLCNTRCCCNPDHLEAVSRSVNMKRAAERGGRFDYNREKTHCPQGHPYSGPNLSIKKRPNVKEYRGCRKCVAAAQASYRARKKAKEQLGAS